MGRRRVKPKSQKILYVTGRESPHPSEHNYVAKLARLQEQGGLNLTAGVHDMAVYHDDWCGIYQGKRCNCDPDIKVTTLWTVQPQGYRNALRSVTFHAGLSSRSPHTRKEPTVMRLLPTSLSMALLVGCLATAVAVAGELECDGPYKGHTPAPKELATVLRNHWAWRESDRKQDDERRANLCQAHLSEANLQGALLDEANLQEAGLSGANLQGALLDRANLQGALLFLANFQEAGLFRANLQRAFLLGANFQKARLFHANLQGADLSGANLQEAGLSEANLQGARLSEANLQADLSGVNLQEASLSEANLQGALLDRANLQDADLSGANLQGARLSEANLQGARLFRTKLQGVVYEPKPDKLPNFWTLTEPENKLETLVFYHSPAALMALRKTFKEGGMYTQERQLTYVIERTKRLQAWDPSWVNPKEEDTRPWLKRLAEKSESLFKLVAFELLSDYGMSPGRALKILGGLIGLFALVYMVALFTAHGHSGIWMVWLPDRVHKAEGEANPVRVTSTFFFSPLKMWATSRWRRGLARGLSVLLVGLYFSLLSAFSLGWRELNVGTWISRMQPREYTLRATGWVRTVSGIQSLLSVYLLALWVLTYFGRPFE
jgi:uncharacterized protein YjbI with pentapeptide repeats